MKNHVVLIIVLFLLVLVTANCTSSNNSELLYIDEKGIIHIEIEKILDNNELKRKQLPEIKLFFFSVHYYLIFFSISI